MESEGSSLLFNLGIFDVCFSFSSIIFCVIAYRGIFQYLKDTFQEKKKKENQKKETLKHEMPVVMEF